MSYAPYSYSKMATHKSCPQKFKLAYIDRVGGPKPASPAMERGEALHKSVELFMRRESEQLHPEIHEAYGQFFSGLRESYQVFPEHKFCINQDFQVVPYDSPDAWVRGFMDLKILPKEGQQGGLIVYEFKTGGIYDEHAAQRWLYGVVALIEHPEFDSVEVITVYFDKMDMRRVAYPRAMLDGEYKPMLQRQIKEIEDDKIFITKPQYMCRYCQFSKENGGPCLF